MGKFHVWLFGLTLIVYTATTIAFKANRQAFAISQVAGDEPNLAKVYKSKKASSRILS